MDRLTGFHRLAGVTAVLALCVVMLGAYVRLSNAGLGCPDWPGCYGHLSVPEDSDRVATANENYPERPVEAAKAWKEMVHRYLAGTLGLLVLALAVLALKNRREAGYPLVGPLLLLGLIIFQAALGMWTVTLQLKPVIVMGHLLGGFASLSVLWWLFISSKNWSISPQIGGIWAWLSLLGVLALVAQIALGGWTSSNYAALACPDFPQCQGQWWPEMDFKEGFILWRGLGVNYEFGVLEHPARTAVHMMHRLGALTVGIYLLVFSIAAMKAFKTGVEKRAALVVHLLLLAQITLGISNVVFHLPLPVAVLHNGTAAVLLLSLLTLTYLLFRPRTGPDSESH